MARRVDIKQRQTSKLDERRRARRHRRQKDVVCAHAAVFLNEGRVGGCRGVDHSVHRQRRMDHVVAPVPPTRLRELLEPVLVGEIPRDGHVRHHLVEGPEANHVVDVQVRHEDHTHADAGLFDEADPVVGPVVAHVDEDALVGALADEQELVAVEIVAAVAADDDARRRLVDRADRGHDGALAAGNAALFCGVGCARRPLAAVLGRADGVGRHGEVWKTASVDIVAYF